MVCLDMFRQVAGLVHLQKHRSQSLILTDFCGSPGLVLSCLLTLYTAVMSFEILFPFGLWVFEPDWLLDHSQLV